MDNSHLNSNTNKNLKKLDLNNDCLYNNKIIDTINEDIKLKWII